MRRQGDGNDGEGAIEARAFGSQGIDVWRLDVLLSVAAEMIGAQGINGDEENVRGGRGRHLCGRIQSGEQREWE